MLELEEHKSIDSELKILKSTMGQSHAVICSREILPLTMADNMNENENLENAQPNSAKKKRCTPSKWKRNGIKKAKTAGKTLQ